MKDNLREIRYITINEAADICKVSRRTIYNWIGEGYLNPIMRTPSGAARIDRTKLLSVNNKRRNFNEDNLREQKV